MASWIIHLRIADALLDRLHAEPAHFIAGNIAPDCGAVTEDGSFDPDMHVTHFTPKGKGECDYLRFFEEYAAGETDLLRRSFYLGYFVHLMTDVLWVERIVVPTKIRLAPLYRADRAEFYRIVKKDWYDLDFRFLQRDPQFRSWQIFCTLMDFENTFLPYYGADHLRVQFRYIRAFYAGEADTERVFEHLTPEQADDFAESAAEEIRQMVQKYFPDLCKMTSKFV